MQYEYPSYSGFRCVACNIGFNNFDDQKKHYFAYHSRNVNTVPAVFPSAMKQMTRSKVRKFPSIELKCEMCNLACSSQATYDIHVNGKKHIKAMNKLAQPLQGVQNTTQKSALSVANGNSAKIDVANGCIDCGINCGSIELLTQHLNGIKHQKVLKMRMYNEMMIAKDPNVYCSNCELYLLPDLMKMHMQGGKHKRKCKDTTTKEPAKKKVKIAEVVTTVSLCGYCGLDFNIPEDAIAHYQTKQHITNLTGYRKLTDFHCATCDLYLDSQDFLDQHLRGFKHYARENRGNQNPEGEFSEKLLKMREKLKSIISKKKPKALKEENDDVTNGMNEDTIVPVSVGIDA